MTSRHALPYCERKPALLYSVCQRSKRILGRSAKMPRGNLGKAKKSPEKFGALSQGGLVQIFNQRASKRRLI
jgi:hypothetical protein